MRQSSTGEFLERNMHQALNFPPFRVVHFWPPYFSPSVPTIVSCRSGQPTVTMYTHIPSLNVDGLYMIKLRSLCVEVVSAFLERPDYSKHATSI